jgi:hypothetical protein
MNLTVHRLRLGSSEGRRFRRMSHINREGSRFLSESDDSTHRCPHAPSDMMISRKSSPLLVSLYSTAPARSAGIAVTRPESMSSFSRLDKSVGDMRGTPRRRSLKRVEPASISRRTNIVHREQTISAAIATGQNCPYLPCTACLLKMRFSERGNAVDSTDCHRGIVQKV